MATIKKFEEIEAWQRARGLVNNIYAITANESMNKYFALKGQLTRAVISIMANIAEGFGRKSEKEFANFLNIAHASAAEVQSHLYIALDQNYIDNPTFTKLHEECGEISKMILGFQNYLRKLMNTKTHKLIN